MRPLKRAMLEALAKQGDWVMPKDIGGSAGSLHAHALQQLCVEGLACKQRLGGQIRTRWSYAITNEGRAALARIDRPATKKVCTKCGRSRLLRSFSLAADGKYGRYSICRSCCAKRPRKAGQSASDTRRWRAINPEKWMLAMARARAKKKGLAFEIAESDIVIPTHCPLLGIPIGVYKRMEERSSSATLDRIDSKKGYVPGNVWVISFRANAIKLDATIEELELLVGNLRRHLNGG